MPPAAQCGRAGVESQASWHPVQPFSLPSVLVSLLGSLDSFAVCIRAVHVCCACVCMHICAVHVCVGTCIYVHAFSPRHFPKSFYQQSNQPNFQRGILLEVRPWVSLCNLFLSPDKRRLRIALDWLWPKKELKWVIFA